MKTYIYAFIVALVLSYIFTPIVKKFAWKIGALDIPNDTRRMHTRPIPRIGGLAIFGAFVLTSILVLPLTRTVEGILLGSAFIVALGVFDDIKNLPAKIKLIGQIAAAGILVLYGIRVEWVTNPLGGMFYLGKLSIPLTIFWIVGVTNALNFIDGLDGLAAGVASIASLALLIVAIGEGQEHVVILTAILTGSAIGFLPFNFNPAKIFMGDTGAMFLGFVLAAISIEGAIKSAAAIALVVPILILGLPIFDTAFAILRRAVNGYPIMKADKGHLHHRLMAIGLNQRQTVLILYSISGLLGISAIVLSQIGLLEAGMILTVLVGIAVVLGHQLGIIDIKNTKKFDV
ncbi:MAG: UDP-GlcNAc:undecaprenyl-phosphate/decaprenyl-phosphate GlcNAc-phosphate transferase [Thermosediminibacterales bacterium]|nr:UDP-GlcNAc:undecaprenyl-phosphate/decaprenyl-phosphate GlcNAc-phosphate transferase [Thermosediminibacterales bacterium]MDK2836026.1 UDP-GlcNAc:undecaprenyl-phosphate/decaprenyl-phosphate GlcNAc-phosphate transferase [Thermosediminibacterales bacterium]